MAKFRFWNVATTEALDDYVEQAVAKDTYVSKSDFIRDAVREKLAKMGITPGGHTQR
jgi:Arc/MetJ-type ribon-helix-helix transcriptional regulator